MKKAVALLIVFATLASCKKTEKTNKLAIADRLIGSWENQMEQGKLVETWEKTNDSTYSGKSYFIKDKDTLSNEVIMLMQKGNDLFYIPTVKGQNNDEPVVFSLTSVSAKQMVFENPKHDFPQKITYRQVTPDSLVAEISGIDQGKAASETYPMSRKK
jgi:hypothetical protein